MMQVTHTATRHALASNESQPTRKRRTLPGVWALLGIAALTTAFAQDPTTPADHGSLTAEALVTAVLERNPSLEGQRAAMAEAAARIKTAGSLNDPMLSVAVAPGTIGNATGLGEDVEVSQALPWWGTLDARAAAARSSADAAQENVQSLALRLRALAQSAFADWWYVHRAIEIDQRHLALYGELRESAKARFAAGLAPEQDVLQADVERTMLRQQALELAQQRSAIQAGIDALLDRPGDAPVPPPGVLPRLPPLQPLAALRAYALAQHPEVRALRYQEHAAEEQITLAQKARFPSFAVNAGYNSMWNNSSMRPMIGVSINVPLDQGKRRAEIDAARAGVRRAQASLADLDARLGGDLTAAYTAVEQARASLALYRDQLDPLADSVLAVSRSEYAAGRGDFLDVIEAERRDLDAQLGLARTEAMLFKRQAELGRLAGTSLPVEIPRTGRTFNADEAPRE